MSTVKQIQCPACGANSTFKQTDGSYRCNYCQSNFELKENANKVQPQKTAVTLNPNATPAKAGCRLGVIMALVSMIGVGASIFFTFRQNSAMKEGVESVITGWQKPELNYYESFAGPKGPIIWLLQKATRTKLDSVKYPFKIIEPSSGKILKEGFYIPEMTWQESFNDSKEMANEFSLWGGLVWNASENNLLRGFDPYTLEEKENEKSLIQRFQELKSGIAKAEIIRYKKSFKLTTNDGDEFVYYPDRNLLRAQKEDDISYRTDTVTTTELYVSDGKTHELWLIKKCDERSRYDLHIWESDAQEVEPQPKKKRRYGGILESKKVSDRKFFRAQPLARHKGNLILIYTESMKKKSAVTMECFNQEGKTVWINKIPELQKLSESPFDNLNCDFSTDNNIVIIDVYEDVRKSLCYDLKTGKLLWTYRLEK